ncbi:MAG: UDP-N-acetylglucosamine 4,6-dehydratase (inverting) [Rhodospirillaceae bacterium]|nr:UDP-N-acetylglucosamine 4,6-dehydratase (inverting) [Rhodospirillaceae bacterium]MBT5665253.1 UDP-N-acetylglucosamine 4,6-dehydratase (inverting) [Rhodospirillaceae bacterium]MBT5810837.1 UDP-N-acetylglucosamine 4,6-dehydratase (inverting) [Rhodospirillaceae bacterium]
MKNLQDMLNGGSILITGGTGSFGKAFVRRVLQDFTPKRLVVFSRDELKQYEMAQEFNDKSYPCIRYFIGDVRDADRLEMAMRGIDYVIHAAALKHVPAAEYNPFECIRTNVHGAENVVNAAIRRDVKQVVALSTDKAANPINLYGASKLASDKIMIAARNLAGADGPRFSVVRYGNVLGSRGSVLPYFRNLIDKGADHLPITDDRMTRFFITLEAGVDFVLGSLAMMVGGEIFIPKIPSVRISALATAMAPDLPQKSVGIRPGEKLHEVMVTEDDARTTIGLEDRYVILPFLLDSPIYEKYREAGEFVPDGFSYSSDTNVQWLKDGPLAELVTQVESAQR